MLAPKALTTRATTLSLQFLSFPHQMASSLALRRLAGGILPPRGSTLLAATRASFNTSSNGALHSRRHYSTPYPFTVVSGLGELVSQMPEIEFTGSQFMVYEKPCGETGTIGEIREGGGALHLMAELPGMSKEDVIVYIHQNQLHVMAEKGRVKETMERLRKKWNKDKEEVEEIEIEIETTSQADDEKLTSTMYFGGLALKPKSYKADC